MINRPFRHLRRSSLLVWALSLLLIASFGGTLGGIFYSVRMKVAYRTELILAGDGLVRCSVPRLFLQAFRPGEPARIKLSDGEDLSGTLRSFSPGPERVELSLEISGAPGAAASGELTLRSQRLLAAFLSPAPRRLSTESGGFRDRDQTGVR